MNTFGAVTERFGEEDLERENARLQKLVAELLARNQQLRQQLELASRAEVAGREWR